MAEPALALGWVAVRAGSVSVDPVRGSPKAGDLKPRAGRGWPRPVFPQTPFIRCQQGQSARSWLAVGPPHGRRGEETETRRARGRARKTWMLQTHRGSAAAAPAPGEMLMGFCRRWRVIGQREFGATSSCRCHWLGAICCSLCRELLAPPPIPFFSAPLPPAARPPSPAPRRLGGAEELSLRKTERAPSGNGGWVPAQAWPPSTSRRDGHWGSFTENRREAMGVTPTHSSVPLSLPFPRGAWGEETWL